MRCCSMLLRLIVFRPGWRWFIGRGTARRRRRSRRTASRCLPKKKRKKTQSSCSELSIASLPLLLPHLVLCVVITTRMSSSIIRISSSIIRVSVLLSRCRIVSIIHLHHFPCCSFLKWYTTVLIGMRRVDPPTRRSRHYPQKFARQPFVNTVRFWLLTIL